jgi:MFS family permease
VIFIINIFSSGYFFGIGLFPGCAYLIGSWYVRFEVQKRLAAFYLFSSLVSGISSLLASGIMQMDGLGGVAGWRWIFIIEGIITVVFSVLSYFIIIDFPDKVQKYNRRVFSNAEVEILKSRIRIDHGDTEEDPITLAKIGTHLCDVKIWL